MKSIKEEQNESQLLERASDLAPPTGNQPKKKKNENNEKTKATPKKRTSARDMSAKQNPDDQMEMPDCLKEYFTMNEIKIAT